MKRKNRDILMSRTLIAMREAGSLSIRKKLYIQAEWLLYEYKNLKVAEVEAALKEAVVP